MKKEETNGYIGNNGISNPKLNEVQLNQSKQETLEEAAVNCWAEGAWDNRDDFTEGFIEGAKWQAKRTYSEEDMKKAFYQGSTNSSGLEWGKNRFNEWFKQFKKNKI